MWANNPSLNSEGYADPTAYLAENKIERALQVRPGYLTAGGVDIQSLKRSVVFVCSPYRGKTKHNVRDQRKQERLDQHCEHRSALECRVRFLSFSRS